MDFRFGQISILDSQGGRTEIERLMWSFLNSRQIWVYRAMPFLFEKLDVYKKAVDFAHGISELTNGFGRGNYYLSDQLNRAALSISANIAEGNGRYHKADRMQFFRIARGSAFECVPILEICRRKYLLTDDQSRTLKKEVEDISKMLSGLINK